MNIDPALPWLAARAQHEGGRTAIRFADRSISWTELAAAAHLLATVFSRLGVVRGDIVAVRMAPHPRMVAMLHALQMLGAALLPLNLRLAAPELQRILAHAGPRLFVDEAKGEGPDGLRRVHPFDDLDQSVADRPFEAPSRIDPDAALTIVYTSGTTSAPRGVVLTNANHAAAAAASQKRLGHGSHDTWLATLPLFHVGGLAILVRSVLEGSAVVLEDSFRVDRVVTLLESGEATMVSVVPTMLSRVLDRMTTKVSARVRCVLVGGAALAPSLGRKALDAGLPVSTTYGMTEACSQICSSKPGSEDAAHGLVGPPLDGVEVAIAGADAEGWGEILVRGPTVMRGYLDNPEADRAALCEGWLQTSDVGRLDRDGRLAVAGRRDDLIVTGGENVSPLEVERVLDEFPDVAESLVIGVDDDEWGQRLVALIVARDGRSPEPDALLAWCRERIATYKLPREFRFTDVLPRGATGKLLRRGQEERERQNRIAALARIQ